MFPLPFQRHFTFLNTSLRMQWDLLLRIATGVTDTEAESKYLTRHI